MRALAFFSLFLLSACSLHGLTACSSAPTSPADEAPVPAPKATTDECLDNPGLSQGWGDCNVKHTLYLESAALAKCRKISPKQRGVVNFELQVKADGRVKNAKAVGDGKKKLKDCLTRVMKKLKFAPPPNGKATISVPYQLEQ